MNDELCNTGRELLEVSRGPGVRLPHGILDELFPYVFEASRRMSIRAICRWLETKGVKVSPMTVSRALRKPEDYWQLFAGKVERWALLVARAQDVDPMQMLFDRDCWEVASHSKPSFHQQKDMADVVEEYEDAVKALEMHWYALSDETMAECKPHFSGYEEDGKETENEDGK